MDGLTDGRDDSVVFVICFIKLILSRNIACRVCDSVVSCVLFFGRGQTEGLNGISVAWRCHPGRSRVGRETIGHIVMLRDGHIA
jgi:hypothetical protein